MNSLSSIAAIACSLSFAVAAAVAEDRIKIEHTRGFHTAGSAEHFREFWESLEDRHKMNGKISEHLAKEQIEAIVMFEVGIAVALGPNSPSMQDELLRFMAKDNHFQTGRLPGSFTKSPRKHLVGLLRLKDGTYGLVTVYRDVVVLELNGRVGVAPSLVP